MNCPKFLKKMYITLIIKNMFSKYIFKEKCSLCKKKHAKNSGHIQRQALTCILLALCGSSQIKCSRGLICPCDKGGAQAQDRF